MRRQTERGRTAPVTSGCALRLDPHALPARFTAGDAGADGRERTVEIDRSQVVVRRRLKGIPMRIALPVESFRGVSVRLLPPEDDDAPPAVAVVLEHRDPDLSVPLFVSPDGDDIVAEWQLWGRVLGRPLIVAEGDGSFREPFPRLGGVLVGPPAPRRRRRGALARRRPSFLRRRKPGGWTTAPVVHRDEREIIARN